MHFSFLAVVTFLTASMSVSACGKTACSTSADCCKNYLCIQPPGRTANTPKVEPAALVVHRDSESCSAFALVSWLMVQYLVRSQSVQLLVDKFSCCSSNVNVWTCLK
ncbi:uncharacterized protein HD556DRAFT_1361856 [Suillus plorans]|uniref:Hydrophobin n=1 Tax=Suillus plorans TaxID=116603 RepID=A0A9P7DIK2_9AGAM|nr:uncharacterized protein HD556DRAFT_1361856 [Suillus plorans]KAG1795967.1 hypothetical protein HD556DRAFT_1361856 [Suillus plorans]